jgi:NlpC/P60 family putative phage cell wall peptidase
MQVAMDNRLSSENMTSEEMMAVDHSRWASVEERLMVVDIARKWLGTPYHHQASRRGAGCDCFGLIRGVWRELYREQEPDAVPAYSHDWAEATKEETILKAAFKHLCLIPLEIADFGDVVVFRYRERFIAKHSVILTAPEKMLHSIEGVGVCEVWTNDWWWRRAAGAYRFQSRASQAISSVSSVVKE